MLDSERTFKIKVGLRRIAFEILLMSTIICIQRVLHGNEIVQYLQNYKVTNLAKVIQESSYRVLQVTSKSKILKQSAYFLKAVEFCPTFFIVKVFFLKTKFVSAFMIFVPQQYPLLLCLLAFHWTCLWYVSALKEEKNKSEL